MYIVDVPGGLLVAASLGDPELQLFAFARSAQSETQILTWDLQ
jgi:hypothetical protein